MDLTAYLDKQENSCRHAKLLSSLVRGVPLFPPDKLDCEVPISHYLLHVADVGQEVRTQSYRLISYRFTPQSNTAMVGGNSGG